MIEFLYQIIYRIRVGGERNKESQNCEKSQMRKHKHLINKEKVNQLTQIRGEKRQGLQLNTC